MGYIISYRDSHEGFLGGPSQKDSGYSDSKASGISLCHRVQFLTILTFVSMMTPMFWGEHPKDILLLFVNNKKGNLRVGKSKSTQRPHSPISP